MHLRNLCGILPLLWAALPQVAAAKSLPPLEPGSGWKLYREEERCSLSRDFGSGKNAAFLELESHGQQTVFRIMLAGPVVPQPDGPNGSLAYKLTPDGDFRKDIPSTQGRIGKTYATSFNVVFLPADVDPDPSHYEEATLPQAARPALIQPGFEQATASIALRLGRGRNVELHLGEMKGPLKVMRSCVDGLYTLWGMEPETQRSIVTPPVPDPTSVRKVQNRYPVELWSNGINAYIPVRIMVDAQGKAGDCVVQEKVQKQFVEAICDGLANRFKPARNGKGEPVASVYLVNVNYQVP